MEAVARAAAEPAEEGSISLLDLTREFSAHRLDFMGTCERVFTRMHFVGGEEVHAFESEMATFLGVRRVRGVLCDRDDVDAMVVATPPSRHHAMALAALRADKHVWVEKPRALSGAEGHELVEAAGASGRILFVDETFLYDSPITETKRLIDEGRAR
jgi:Oxidoreductase family, NAD-binding Rossmann fold